MSVAADHFERLGLPRRFSLDARGAERNYLARSRAVHPDFHQSASAAERRASEEASAALNEAYAVLRDPFRRAEYLLQLEGGPSAAEHKDAGPAFLEEMLELRMQIEEAREAGAESPERAELERGLVGRREALLREVGEQFARYEAMPAGDMARAGAMVEVRRRLNALKYVQGLLRDLRAD